MHDLANCMLHPTQMPYVWLPVSPGAWPIGCRNKTNSLFGWLFSFLGQATRVQIPTLIQAHGIRAKSSSVASQDALAQSELGFSLALELSASPLVSSRPRALRLSPPSPLAVELAPRLLSPSSSPPSPLALELSVPCLLSPSSSPSRLLSASSSHSPVACRPRALAPSTLVAGEDLNPSGCVKRYEVRYSLALFPLLQDLGLIWLSQVLGFLRSSPCRALSIACSLARFEGIFF
jgi:hypothetical protein